VTGGIARSSFRRNLYFTEKKQQVFFTQVTTLEICDFTVIWAFLTRRILNHNRTYSKQ